MVEQSKQLAQSATATNNDKIQALEQKLQKAVIEAIKSTETAEVANVEEAKAAALEATTNAMANKALDEQKKELERALGNVQALEEQFKQVQMMKKLSSYN